MLIRNFMRFLTLSILIPTAIISFSITISAQSNCDNFVNICTVPSSFNTYTISEGLIGMTGQVGEPQAHSTIATSFNPLQTVWFHWTPTISGFVTADTKGTNANAIAPAYTTPFVIDTTIAVYTGSTLTTLTRVSESNDWVPNSPPNSNCTVARPVGESLYSSCMRFFAVAGTTYHFQVDKLAETNPANNQLLFNVKLVAPTASTVSIGGRVINDYGRGVSRTVVTLTDSNGNTRTATTNQFGYYRFTEVESGQNYILQAQRKGYQFENNPRVLNVNEDLTGEDFTGANPFTQRE